jgi:hypothetical protein
MTKQEQIAQEVMKTLQCFEHRESIECSPFFSTRVLARIRRLEEEKRVRSLRKVFSLSYLRPALLILIVVLNIVSAIMIFQGSRDHIDVRGQYLTAFANEYGLNQQQYDLFLSN